WPTISASATSDCGSCKRGLADPPQLPPPGGTSERPGALPGLSRLARRPGRCPVQEPLRDDHDEGRVGRCERDAGRHMTTGEDLAEPDPQPCAAEDGRAGGGTSGRVGASTGGTVTGAAKDKSGVRGVGGSRAGNGAAGNRRPAGDRGPADADTGTDSTEEVAIARCDAG